VKPEGFVAKGNEAWAEETPEAKLVAAEWYYRALPTAVGLNKTLVEKRLLEMGGTAVAATSREPGFVVDKAFYGVGRQRTDVTQTVKTFVENKQCFALQPDRRVFGDPVPNNPKKLYMQGKCDGKAYSLTIDDSTVIAIPSFPAGGAKITGASQEFRVLAAMWGAGLTWVDMAETFRKHIVKPDQPLRGSGMKFPRDPWYGEDKHLVVWFDFRGSRYTRILAGDAPRGLLTTTDTK
jgi:hypothetical protein